MRKSGRLASIHEDDDNSAAVEVDDTKISESSSASSNASALKNKKFVPTIPTVRRKKMVIEDDDDEGEGEVKVETKPTSRFNNPRKPLPSRQQNNPTVVSGPLSLGPAAVSRSNARATGIISARSISRSSSTSSSLNSSNSRSFNETFPIENEFGLEDKESGGDPLIKPVALIPNEIPSDATATAATANITFEANDQLFLFQMPPVLPSLLNASTVDNSSASSDIAEADKWSVPAQGRYGKLRRYKSGKLVLILENGVEFLVSSSSELSNEAQTTNVLAIDPEFAQSFNLGPVQHKMVCVPEFEKFQKL